MSAIPFTGECRGQPWDTTHSPEGLWLFDSNTNDTSGNGRNFAVGAGAAFYVQTGILIPDPGTYEGACFYSPQNTRLQVTNAGLSIPGDITVSVLVFKTQVTDPFAAVVQCGVAPNIIYRLGWNDGGVNWFWQDAVGAGQNAGTGSGPRALGWNVVTASREDDGGGGVTARVYVNGVKTDERTLNPAIVPGATQTLYAFNNNLTGADYEGLCAGIKIVGSALTDAQVIAEHRRVLPMYVDQDA